MLTVHTLTTCEHTQTHPQVVLSIVKEEPNFAVGVREKHLLKGDHIVVFQLTQ